MVVDGISLPLKALVTDCDIGGADMVLGQPAFALSGVRLLIDEGKANQVIG